MVGTRYSVYTELVNELKKNPYIDFARMESFIVNLDDKIHYRDLTLSTLAKHLLEMNDKEELAKTKSRALQK